MKAILKPFFALCGLVALSTALSADSRLFPAGGGGAGWGEPGFLYSDYLQTAAASGREVEFQGSFVLDNRRPFLAELGTAFPGRVVDEVKSLPLREWGLGYVFEKRRPAHQRALLERGWRLADWLAEETLMAATESSRGGGLIRTLEFDLQSELGGRRAQVGLNVLGALRESNDEAIAWQFRGFKSSGGLGGNTGLIWRRAVANDRALAGANVFLDYETYADENFWRGSAGAELRSAWADVFGNVYRGFSDDVKKNNRTTYTADGYDVELNVHSPELPWLVGEVAYYNFEGKAGDKDDDGVRFGLRFNPLTDLELGVEYDNGDSDDDGKKKWAARIRYSGEFGGVLKAQYRPSTNSGNFEPRDWFFAPVEREYSQRIRKAGDTGSNIPTFTFSAADNTALNAILPIRLQGQGGSLDLTIPVVTSPGGSVILMGMVNGAAITPRPVPFVVDTATNITTYSLPVAQAIAGTITVTHKGSSMTYAFPRTDTTVTVKSDVAISTEEFDYLALLDGTADILLGSGGGMFVAEQRLTTTNDYRRFTVFANAAPNTTLTLGLVVDKDGADTQARLPLPLPDKRPVSVRVEQVIGNTTTNINLERLRASVELANDPFLTDTSPPSYYKNAGAASNIVILGTLQTGGGGGGPYTSSKVPGSGDLVINNGVVGIPTSQEPAKDGNTLVLQIMVNDNSSDAIGAETPALVVNFTVVYQEIVPLAASLPGFSGIPSVYGVLGDSARKVVATAAVVGSGGAITYSPIDGALRLEAGHVLYIPAGNPPAAGPGGNLLTLNSEVRQATNAGVPAMTVTLGLTLRYIGLPAVSANLTPIVPAISTGLNSFAITAEAGDTGKMDVFSVAGSGGAGGTFTYRKITGELDFAHDGNQRVSIPSGMAPRTQPYSVVIEIQDSGTGATETPHYTLTVQVRYFSVNEVNLSFDDRDENPTDGLVTVFGLQDDNEAQNNVARVVAGGGFGGVTLAKVGSGGLELSGTASGAQINIPANNPPQPGPDGRELLITVSANDSAERDPNTNGITDPKTATMTLHYVQVNQLGGAYYPVNSNGNGQVPSGASQITAPVHTVGMAAATTQFTVASLSVSGGVGNYNYREIGGGRELSVDNNGQILMAQGIVPNPPDTGSPYEIVVEVNDDASHANGGLTPAVRFTLTVSYNTIVPLAARVLDTRDDATPLEIANGGRVYFLKSGANANATFGRLVVSGGFPSPADNYTITPSSQSGIAYDTNTGNLSMTKCTDGTKSIRFTINDVGDASATDLTDELVVNFAVTSGAAECLDPIAAQLRNAANDADATSPLEIFGVEGKTEATVVAAWNATGGGGDLNWTSTGNLRLVPGNNSRMRQVQIPTGTSPEASPGNPLSVTVVVNDENDKGGFLTEPLTVEATVNYIEVPAVQLELTRGVGLGEIAISDVLTVYGVESVAKSQNSPDRSVANIAVSGGASNNYEVKLQISGDGATTADTFEIVFDHRINITKVFPAFDDGGELATVAVVVSDTGTNSEVTPDVTMRATVQILPVLGAVQAGGNIVEQGNSLNVVAPTSPSATEGSFTVYVLEGETYTEAFARVSAAATGDGTRDNATVSGVSRLLVDPPTRHPDSTPAEASGLLFSLDGSVAQIRIAPGATPTPSGADLKLVLTYNDRSAFTSVANLTDWLLKTVSVHYESVEAFEPKVRNAAGSEDLGNKEATVYVAPTNTSNRTAAKIMKVGGAGAANADMRIVSQTSTPGGLQVMPNGDVVVLGTVAKDTTLTVVVVLDDTADGDAAGSVTDHATLTATVAYLESRDVVANLVPLPATDNHFLGDAATDGTRTVYWKASETRAKLPLFRLNAASGSGQYTYSTAAPFGLTGFELSGLGNNDRMLELLASIGDGVKAFATVEIDDTGNADEIALTDPATLMATVEVKLVRAIDTALLVPENVPGGAPVGTTLGGLYVRSAAAANSSSVYIASVVARGGVEEFTYTRQSESSAELLLNDDGQVHLAANYVPDGNKTLSIIIAANDGDSVDGSTLTEAAMITLEFVLAETIGAELLLRSNGGEYLPGGSGGNQPLGSQTRTVKVKTDEYDDEHIVVGINVSGGLGNSPAFGITRIGGNENGLVARNPSGPGDFALEVAVKSGADASSAPQTFGITAVVNESSTDPNNLTPGATISVTVIYDKVDPIAAAFQDMDGNAIAGRHVVAKQGGADTNDLHVANLVPSGGVGGEGGGNTYNYDYDGAAADLLVNAQGQILVKGGTVPEIGKNIAATVIINDTGNWAHVSEPLTMEITVLYSSEVPVNAAITETRTAAPVQAIVPNSTPPQTIYFNAAAPHANIPFAQITYTSGLPTANDFDVVASAESGLNYDATNKQLRINAKCNDSPAENKSIRLVVDDKPDPNNVSKPLTVDITVHSGAAECIAPINVQARNVGVGGQPSGSAITEPVKLYGLAGTPLAAKMAVATVFIDDGAPAYTSSKSGGGLELEGNNAELLTVFLPAGAMPGSGANGNQLAIDIRINDDADKGGFLTPEAKVEITVNYIEVQPHGQITGQKAAGVTGDLESGMLTVRRVAASSTPFNILTNIEAAIPNKEAVGVVGSYTGILYTLGNLQMDSNQQPDGLVRIITLRVSDNTLTETNEPLQTAARPDRTFTISVRYLGELEAAAYDSETETKIETSTGDINRYVESDEGAVAVATVSVSGGTSPYSYTLVAGGLELGTDLTNMTVLIPASAVPSAAPGLKLTARIEINDTGRADTDSLNVDLTANYIMIPGHSNLTLVRDGETTAEDLDGSVIYPLIRDAQDTNPVAALSEVGFKTPLVGEALSRVDGDAALLFDATAKQVRVAGGTPLNGQTLTLKLRGSDGDGETSDSAAVRAQKAARSDRLYTVAVRYLEELTAKALEEEGGTEISGVREIKVPTGQTSKQAAAYIQIEGGTEGYQLEVVGEDSVFELDDRVLSIKDGTQPGALADGGELLTATVSVNDNESEVGGPQTDAVLVEVEFKYIALPPVEASFDDIDGNDVAGVLNVYNAYNVGNQPATIAATAKATVTNREGETYTFRKVGGGILVLDTSTGEISIPSTRPQGGTSQEYVITVEFSGDGDSSPSLATLTVRYNFVRGIVSGGQGMQSLPECHPGPQINGGGPNATAITVSMEVREAGYEYRPTTGRCSTYLVFAQNIRTAGGARGSGGNLNNGGLTFTTRDAKGLVVRNQSGELRVGVINNQYEYTAETNTLSVVIVYSDVGAGSHVTDDFLRTVYVVFPGVPKIEAALETPAGAAIDKPLTVYVAATDANPKVVASVKASGGEGTEYSYTGTRTGGDSMALLLVTTADSNNIANRIAVPGGFEAAVSPGTNFQFEVAVDDTGGDQTRRGATSPAKVILTVQYIKTSGDLEAEAVYATPNIYEASSTTFYGAKDVALTEALNVASITPSGGIPNPNYTFAIEGNADNTDLEITGSGNERVVRLKSGVTPSAATAEARRRMITVRVSDTGDVGNSIQPMTMDVVVSVNFVEVTAHADLVVENGGTGIGSDFVVVRPTTQSDAVAVADKVAVADASLSESTTEAADGLSFVSGGDGALEIDSGANPPTGKTLSIVLIATDGTTTPQAAARQDKTYTVSVRYVPAIAAEVQDSSDNRIAAVVELTVLQGVQSAHVVGKIAASGGVTNSYTYAPTAVSGSENLQVDANGDIRIPTGVTPLPGDGRTITVEIAVDDATAADSGETDPANVQITVKYVLLEAPAIEAQNLAGNALDNTNTPTFYRLSGDDLDSDMPVAKVAGSKGSGDYTFAIVDEDGAVNANGLKLTGNDGTTLALASGETAAAAGSADRVVTVRLTDTDNRLTSGNTADVIVTVRFEEVAAHADVTFNPQSGITPNTDNEYRVVQAGAPGANVHVLNLVSSDTLSRTEGDAQLVFVAGSPPRLEILDSTPRDGRTLTVVISQTDNDDNDQEIARPDRTYTISVRYIPALAAEARNAADDAVLNAPIVITSKAGLRQVARIAVSGGTSDSYDFTIENLHPAGNDLIVGSSDGIVSIPLEVEPVVGGLALTVRITANDKTDSKDNDATNPASALVTVMYHLLEAPEIEAQNLAGTELDNTNTPTFYLLAGTQLANDLPVAKVVGSKGSGSYSYAILGADAQGVANGMRVDNSGNEGNIVIVSGQSAAAAGSADRIITVELTDTQTTPEKDDVIITVRFEAVNPHADVVFNPVANNNGEHVVVRAGTQQTAVNVASFNTPSGDTLTKAGDAALVLNSGQVQIVGGTAPDAGQTLVAVITQSDTDNTTPQAIERPDRTYTISVRYIPALAAEARDAAGTAALVLTDGTLVIEKESAASLNIASIAVSGGTSSDYDYSIANMHDNNELGVTPEGVVYIPLSVAPLPTDGLSLTVEITANDKTASKDNGATDAVVASITVRYVMDPGLGGQVQAVLDNSEVTSPTVIYRLVNLATPDEGLATGLKVVGLRGDSSTYQYAIEGTDPNPDGLSVDSNGVISIVALQTPESSESSTRVRVLTVKISGDRNGNPREALVTVSVKFLGVGAHSFAIDSGTFEADKNAKGEYVVVRDKSDTAEVRVIESFVISKTDSVAKHAGSVQLLFGANSQDGYELKIASGTVPGGQPPVSGGLTLIANIRGSDNDDTPQKRARPDLDHFITVIYLANIAPTLENAGGTAFPDLTDVDISGPTGGASLFVGNIAATGGDTGESGGYTYNKVTGDLELDTTNGQVFISGKTPTADEGEPLFIEVDVNDTGGDNSDETDAKRIRIDVDYILDPGLSGQVQNLDGTEATSTPIIYLLAGDTVPGEGLATGLKVVGQRGDAGYTYAIEGTSPNPDGLSVDTSNGVISIVANQTPDTDTSKVRVVTVKISGDRNGSPSEALVTVSVIFRAVEEIASDGAGNFQIQSNNRCGIPRIGGSTFQRNVLPLAEEGTEYSHTNACQFFTLIDESRTTGFGFKGGSGGFDKAVVGTPNGLSVDQRGTDLRIQLSSQPVLYTAERLTLDIVIAYNDNGPAKDLTAEHRKTIEIVLPGVPSVDAVLNDEGGNAIADIAAIEKRGPGNLSVFVGNIVASGGDGNLAIVKDATDGGDLGIDNNGQVYIPDSVQPAAGAGNQLHLLVNINDDGANSGLTKQKQLRIEVDYILQLGLAGQTQDLEDNNVSGEHVVYRQAGVAVPTEGLTVVKVVGERGTSPYTYAVEGDASGSKLVLHTASGSVAIAANETASNQLLELTVRISDNASPAATALHTVSIRFNSVAPHADLTRELAAGVTQNSAGEYVVAQDGAQTQSFQVLTKIKSDEGAAVNRIGTDPIELQYVFNTFSDEGNLKIGGNTVPTGQTLSFQVVATDGNGEDSDSAEVKAQKTARQDRTFDIAVRYLSHLQTPTLQDTNDADIDLSSAVLVTAAGGASVYVGDIAASGGTGEYTFGKDATTGGLTVSPAGQVYLRSDAVPTSEGAAFAITVNVNDSGKDNEVTNGTAIEITVNYILQETGPTLPLYAGDLVVYRDKGAGGLGRNRICPFNTLCEEIVGIITPEIVPTGNRLTVFGFNTDTAPVFIMSVGFSAPGPITEASGSHFSVGAAQNAPNGTKRHSVMLKTENLKRWGQELEARFRVRSPDNTLEQLVTVTVLLAERIPPASLTVGARSIDGGNAGRPMQWIYPNDLGATDEAPGFQAVADFPGMTVADVEFERVRVTSLVGANPGVSTWGDFEWDEDAKIVRRKGILPAGSDPFYNVWLRGKAPNPKMVPVPLSFRLRARPVAPMTWVGTPPSTISPSGVTSFEVRGGPQSRNYSPFADMVATVDNAMFVISNMSRTKGGNDARFSFDVGVAPGTPSGTHTATITVTDRGYTSGGTLTQPISVEVP